MLVGIADSAHRDRDEQARDDRADQEPADGAVPNSSYAAQRLQLMREFCSRQFCTTLRHGAFSLSPRSWSGSEAGLNVEPNTLSVCLGETWRKDRVRAGHLSY